MNRESGTIFTCGLGYNVSSEYSVVFVLFCFVFVVDRELGTVSGTWSSFESFFTYGQRSEHDI